MGTHGKPPTGEAEWKQRDWDEAPAHKAKVTKPFYFGAYEVTNAQYEQFDPTHKKFRALGNASKTDDEPVTMVTWQQAVSFCKWLSIKEARSYRLPTEDAGESLLHADLQSPIPCCLRCEGAAAEVLFTACSWAIRKAASDGPTVVSSRNHKLTEDDQTDARVSRNSILTEFVRKTVVW